MLARLNFAIATMQSPEILLIDEGIGAGDQSFKDKVEARVKNYTKNANIVIAASHSNSFLEQICNKGFFLKMEPQNFKGLLPML